MATFTQAALDADTADALSRRREAEASVFRDLAARDPLNAEAFKSAFDQAGTEAADMGRKAAEMRPSGVPDPEGTRAPLSDRRGAYADDADQANQGGIGVFDSNSRTLEDGEGTPNARLNPETTGSAPFVPSTEDNKAVEQMPEGGEVSREEQEAFERQRLAANLGGLAQPVETSAETPKRRGRPPGSRSAE